MRQEKKNDANQHKIIGPMGTVRPTPIITDPQGCYTGRPIEKYEIPVQDADDL